MECQTCSGTRFVSVQRQQVRRKRIQYTADGRPAWPNIGAYAVMEEFPTGRMATYLELCPDCEGSGLAVDPAHDPDCWQCHGTGEYGVMDSFGHYDGAEQCHCEAPVAVLEVS